MVSVKSLNNTVKAMKDKHGSGEGARYEDIRENVETFNSQLDEIKRVVAETRTKLSEYAQASEKLNTNLDHLWKKALDAPTCKLKINEIRKSLRGKNNSVQRDVSQHIERIEETTDLGSVEGSLHELSEKLKADAYSELKQQVESLETNFRVFQVLKPHCSDKKAVRALEQLIFLRGLETPFNAGELVGYVEELTETEAKKALDELVEKNCGLVAEYTFNMDSLKKLKNKRNI